MNLNVRIKPSSKFNRAQKDASGNWLIRIKAPPVDGKANEELIRFLSGKLRIPKSSVTILSGEGSKFKRLSVEGVTPSALEALLLGD